MLAGPVLSTVRLPEVQQEQSKQRGEYGTGSHNLLLMLPAEKAARFCSQAWKELPVMEMGWVGSVLGRGTQHKGLRFHHASCFLPSLHLQTSPQPFLTIFAPCWSSSGWLDFGC